MNGLLHPDWTPDRLDAFATVVRAPTGDRQATITAFQALDQPHKDWMAETVLQGAVSLAGGNAYIVPVLSAQMCDDLLAWSDGSEWAENEGEEAPYRMEEIVIAHHDAEYDEWVKTILLYGLAPYLACVWGKLPDAFNSVQFTRYAADLRSGGAFHVDLTSKYTAVIALNDDFEGGGTRLCSGVFGSVLVPPAPKGWALLFKGRDTFHKGETVTKGTRKLLTVWADDDDCSH